MRVFAIFGLTKKSMFSRLLGVLSSVRPINFQDFVPVKSHSRWLSLASSLRQLLALFPSLLKNNIQLFLIAHPLWPLRYSCIYWVWFTTLYMQSYFEVDRETRFTNPLRIPHEGASSSLVSGKWGYLRQSRNIPITMQNCAITQVLSFC